MGLDMYLTAERYMSDVLYPADKPLIEAVTAVFPELDGQKVKTVTTEVGYWRKANAIHKWFVDNVQGGVDECQKAYVETDHMQSLLDAVNEVLADNSKADTLLPPEAGFFFGSTDIDEWYLEDLKSTKEILEKILNNEGFNKNYDFYYQSSW